MTSDATLNSVSSGQVSNLVTNTQNTSVKLASDFNEFLTLLTTQLQNQDPLNPMDSTEFTNQLVQFSQVEQAINQNQKLDAIINQNLQNATSMALGYVGMDVTYSSVEMPFDGETPSKITYILAEKASTAKLNITDEEGFLVYSGDVSTIEGKNEFSWDGIGDGGALMPAGTYSFTIDALDLEGNAIENIPTAVTGRVQGVENQAGVPFLIVGERAVEVVDVINASVPPLETTAASDESDTEGDAEDDEGGAA
jgi:flagellar basal-body rod modification protein FlgD